MTHLELHIFDIAMRHPYISTTKLSKGGGGERRGRVLRKEKLYYEK